MLGSAVLSTFSLIIACIVRTRERFMGIGGALTMPIFFASNSSYPIALMSTWLQMVARINPLTYEVDGRRGVMLAGSRCAFGLGREYGVLVMVAFVTIGIATRMYLRLT